MRKDAKVSFAVGGVLLAVLVVYFVSTTKKKSTTGTPPVVAVLPQDQTTVPPTTPPDTIGGGSTSTKDGGSNIAGPIDGGAVSPPPAVDPPKKLPTGNMTSGSEKGPIDPPKIERNVDAGNNSGGSTLENPSKPRATGSIYVVKANQTLSTISMERYGTTKHWIDIQNANPGMNPKRMQIGDKLVMPDLAIASTSSGSGSGSRATSDIGPGYDHVIPPDDQSMLLATDTHVSTHTAGPAAGSGSSTPSSGTPSSGTPSSGAPPVPGQVYHVRSGDSLYKISKLAYRSGKHADAIYEANRAAIGADKSRLKLDMPLTIPELPAATAVTDAGH